MQRRGFVMAGLASGLALRAGASAAGATVASSEAGFASLIPARRPSRRRPSLSDSVAEIARIDGWLRSPLLYACSAFMM